MVVKSLGIALATAAVFVAAMPAVAQGPIRLGASLSLTGTYAQPGRFQHEGYQLCQKDLNAKGGLLGRKVEFVVYDDKSDPATGVRLYEKLITEDKVDAVMGPYSSPITEAVAIRVGLTLLAVSFVAVFVVVPLSAVFAQALDQCARQQRVGRVGARE